MNKKWILYGSELSPFTLKLKAIFEYRRIPYRFLCTEGSAWENITINIRKESLVKGLITLTCPKKKAGDEFPLVPYVFGPNGQNLYDSTAIAYWLAAQGIGDRSLSFLADDRPEVAFLMALIDDYADDYGLYMVHHNRWKFSALDNTAGARLGHEMRSLLGPLKHVLDQTFSARQTRRLPYLFSVAPTGFRLANLPKRRQPPTHADFPPTHALLEQSFSNLLKACELIFSARPYLLGERFSLADASLYGQLGMNLTDPSAARWIKTEAPITYAWLLRMSEGDFKASQSSAELILDETLRPLLTEICRTYVPLMQQNLRAYEHAQQQGESLFNEKAFNAQRAIYTGDIDGVAFKHVAKSFQANTWQALRQQWDALSTDCRATLMHFLPTQHGLDR